ncbi:ammonium transporter Rh type B-like [Pelobates cultripes]|uniref:Ammonium transporter Rh type B-like n=1 Tax=Pelobates cultripes TaxID=61616 RepID=A0AAD1SM97_PELCU|nr:ammonium transporter Rh type B-like [Pelobates cultripes]
MSIAYNPSLQCQLPIILALFQGGLLVVFILYVDYDDQTSSLPLSNSTLPKDNQLYEIFPFFKDINVMLFIGLGLMLSFLKLYSFGGVAFNFLIANFSIQWSLVVQGFFNHYEDGRIKLGLENVLNAEFAAVTAMISAGAILGRVSPIQLLILCLLEIPLYVVNDWLIHKYFHIIDVGGTVAIHVFSCYFGLGISRIFYHPELRVGHTKETTTPNSDLLSLVGTLFLWIFWPSFNSVVAKAGNAQHRAVLNTFLALSASTLTTFAMSSLLSKKGQISLVHLQNATLAGGVAIAISADMIITPGGALGLGCLASISCILGFQYLSPLMARRLKVQDQCGIHNLHGLPGIIGTLGSIIAVLFSPIDISDLSLNDDLYYTNGLKEGSSALEALGSNGTWNSRDQAMGQAAALGVTFGISLLGGYMTGLLLKIPCLVHPSYEFYFDDQPYFQIKDISENNWNSKDKHDRNLLMPLKEV